VDDLAREAAQLRISEHQPPHWRRKLHRRLICRTCREPWPCWHYRNAKQGLSPKQPTNPDEVPSWARLVTDVQPRVAPLLTRAQKFRSGWWE
jgi:hypothetical protein